MTNINTRKHDPVQSDSKAWLASPHGTEPNAMPSITVDTALFSPGAKTNGYIPSGVLVSETATEGVYGPYSADGTGRHGILFQAIDTSHGDLHFGTAMLVHGYVFGDKLPGGAAAVTAIGTDLPLIYVY
jgi:hypothetical protein